jgi:AbrB family looped-hinge helix DNA binding protein
VETTIDRFGRLVIPKPLRERAGIGPGDTVRITWTDGHLEIEATAVPEGALERRGGRLVVPAPAGGARLTREDIDRVIAEIRDERGS